jgi:hypothetical protein
MIDASGTWIIMREYMRARHPDKMGGCDAAFYDAYIGGCLDADQFRAKHGWVFDLAGPFAAEFEGYMKEVGTFGGDIANCTIDYQELACMAYAFALMSQAERRQQIDFMIKMRDQGVFYELHPACAPVRADGAYGTGPRPTAQFPPVPMDASGESLAKKGLSTGQKVGIAIGVAAAAVLTGIAFS